MYFYINEHQHYTPYMKVGIPKEIAPGEARVGATPKTVTRLIKQGFDVFIETKAGEKSNYSDLDYTQSGAAIILTAKDLYVS